MPRTEIHAAIDRIRTRTGRETFTMTELISEMQGSKLAYTESTIQVWVNTAEDLEQVERGVYRVRASA